MTLTPTGFDDDLTQTNFARLRDAEAQAGRSGAVVSGFAPKPSATVARAVTLTGPGVGVVPGIRGDMDTDTTWPVHDAIASGTRLDYGVLAFAWQATTVNGITYTAKTLTPQLRKGTASSLPVLTQTAGVLWEEPVYSVVVRPTAGVFAAADVTDERRLPVRTVGITLPGNFAAVTPALTLRRTGRLVELSGAFQRTTTAIALGGSAINTVLVPAGFRPAQDVYGMCVAGITGTAPQFHTLILKADGTITLTPGTAPIAVSDTLRVVNLTWLTEVS